MFRRIQPRGVSKSNFPFLVKSLPVIFLVVLSIPKLLTLPPLVLAVALAYPRHPVKCLSQSGKPYPLQALPLLAALVL